MLVSFIASTHGKGHWTDKAEPVEIIQIYLNHFTEGSQMHGELHAIFNKRFWNTAEKGLIYTDETWMKEFNEHLAHRGGTPVHYSEQGMQGENYVSMDVNHEFLSSPLGVQLREEMND